MKEIKQKFKKGVASFYIVAFSTLILVIVAASFAMVILSEVTRTANDDLSQSAYDSALAGVEDAKLAFSRYRKCLTDRSAIIEGVSCEDIIRWMENPDCYMVARILGRIGKDEEGEEVILSDMTASGGVTTEQAYTCVIMNTVLSDYRSDLTSSNQARVIKVKFGKDTNASNISAIRLNWYSTDSNTQPNYSNFASVDSKWRVAFDSLSRSLAATPPTIELQIIQTAGNFSLAQMMGPASGENTDRATLYFVPTNQAIAQGDAESYISIHNAGKNTVTADKVVNTNNEGALNKPFLTWCSDNKENEFACSVEIGLPNPIGGTRSNDTFMLMLALPYGQPDTDFSIEFICNNVSNCPSISGDSVTYSEVANLDMQVMIDSTGRANDLYRRVETRLDLSSSATPYPYYAVQLFGDNGDGNSLVKTMYVNESQ